MRQKSILRLWMMIGECFELWRHIVNGGLKGYYHGASPSPTFITVRRHCHRILGYLGTRNAINFVPGKSESWKSENSLILDMFPWTEKHVRTSGWTSRATLRRSFRCQENSYIKLKTPYLLAFLSVVIWICSHWWLRHVHPSLTYTQWGYRTAALNKPRLQNCYFLNNCILQNSFFLANRK